MASKVAVTKHPIPVLASMGWEVPSSGECALYAEVCTSEALEEFCSLLLSARFGSVDALLDILGRVHLDAHIDDEHVRTCKNPSDQEQSSTCYAHATAAVLHMALLRIIGREGGCPSIAKIRRRILKAFPPGPHGRNLNKVLKQAVGWYRPLRFRLVDEDSARQAILHRRPVLATFRLSKPGWKAFGDYFETDTSRCSILTEAHMAPHRSFPDDGGHAVVLTRCDPRSLTFLNSWGKEWGNNGSFSIESPTVLEREHALRCDRMCFYDVYWIEDDLIPIERQAYDKEVNKILSARAAKHPSILELEIQCPLCQRNAPIADFTGNINRAVCPQCEQPFKPEPGYLIRALYAKAGFGDAV
jgi:hypothetical protein